jgi:hypothetical protein
MTERDDTQRVVIEWGERCFGVDHMRDKIVRAARFFEEAAELAQAVGLPKEHAQRALDYVYSRPAGDPAQELGGVSNTQYALAGALGLSVAECQAKEIARCLAKTPEHFAQRNREKIEKIDASPPQGAMGEEEIARIICDAKDIDPETLYQTSVYRPPHGVEYPEDSSFVDSHGVRQPMHRAWRMQVRLARAILSRLRPVTEWQPIKTAPEIVQQIERDRDDCYTRPIIDFGGTLKDGLPFVVQRHWYTGNAERWMTLPRWETPNANQSRRK